MVKKLQFASCLTVLLLCCTLFLAETRNVEAAGTIYIRADGRIDPPTAPIFTSDLVTYTLTGDIYDSIVVQRNNTIIDGDGYAVAGSGTGNGFTLAGMSNVTITNTNIRRFEFGVHVYSSTLCEVSENNISDCAYNGTYPGGSGICLDAAGWGIYTSDCKIIGNIVTGNKYGIFLRPSTYYANISGNLIDANSDYGLWVSHGSRSVIFGNNVTSNYLGIYFNGAPDEMNILRNNTLAGNQYNFGSSFAQDVDTSNTVDGKPIYFWVGRQNETVPQDAGCVLLMDCFNITVKNLTLAQNRDGIRIGPGTANCTILQNRITRNMVGISLWRGVFNVISDNDIEDNRIGIHMHEDSPSYNIIRSNRIVRNLRGLSLGDCFNLTIVYNAIVANEEVGIFATLDMFGIVFHHNLMANTVQLDQLYELEPFQWDDGYPSGGNFWSDYNGTDLYSGPYQNETGSDGIGDSMYVALIPSDPSIQNQKDRYPLMAVPIHTIQFYDVNGDRVINMFDLYLVALHFGELPTSPGWDWRTDVDFNRLVNMLDLYIVATHYGETA